MTENLVLAHRPAADNRLAGNVFMTEPFDSEEKAAWELDNAYQAAVVTVAHNEVVYQAVADALGRIAREQYPGLGDWDARQLRDLAEFITDHAGKFTAELADLNLAAEEMRTLG